jgi:peptide/nickel transport system substrate-binding protein
MLRSRLTRRRFIGTSAAAVVGLAAYGCRTPFPAAPGRATAPGPTTGDRSAGATVELAAFGAPFTMTNLGSVGGDVGGDLQAMTHSALSILDHDARVIPMLAERLPSVDDGTWVINSDGTMRQTWNLRRNAKWHDGHPFTSKDLQFSWEFNNDPALPTGRTAALSGISAIDTPDDYTAILHWKSTTNQANLIARNDLHIHPEHIVRPLWEAHEIDPLLAHPFFHEGFVGLGPYRIERWSDDGTIVLKRFEDFFLGTPKIGTMVHHTTSNALGVLTMLLAGSIHRTSRNGLGFEEGLIAKDQWEAKGEGTVYFVPVGCRRLLLPADSQPLFRDVRVRRALLTAIDREQVINGLVAGQAKIAHIPLAPNEPGFAAAETAATKYSFDPRQALALFEQVGWRRGTDGVLANAAGERFEFPFQVPAGDNEQVQLQTAIAGFWTDIGVRVILQNATDAQLRDRQLRETLPGVSMTDSGPTIASLSRRWHSSQIPTAENRYVGDNPAHWNNSQADRILERIDNTFRPQDMEPLLVEFAKLYSEEMPALTLFYTPEVTASHKYLQGARPRPAGSGQNTWNWSCYEWEWTGP